MRNVNLRVTDELALSIRELRGTMVSTATGRPPVFDDKSSYVVDIDSGVIAMDMASLEALLNQHVFAYRKAPIKDVEVGVEEGRLEPKGVLHKKGLHIPFKMKGEIEATLDGRIRVHPRSIKAVGLPVRPFMRLFGIELDDLVKIPGGRGVTVEDNDLLLDPQQMLPPPHIRGRVASVRIEGAQVVQTFGAPGRDQPLSPPAVSRNHIYFRGGEIQFGKLTMHGADLELIDDDPSDPFDFSVDHYNDQLVAGYSKNTPAYGLKTHMPDYSDLRANRAKDPGTGARP
jgi:hypothetical protein